jgi:transaldolase
MDQLKQLEQFTMIVADTGDIDSIRQFSPVDATTNPSLILKTIQSGAFDRKIVEMKSATENVEDLMDLIAVEVGCQILELVDGYVSTEVDARLSFDTEKTIEKARKLIGLYESKGWPRDRILIKIASTWEGIQAAKVLELEGIRCNLTLLFSMEQARACADINATLISPFVGRILDWYKAKHQIDYTPTEDPGVISVKEIYNVYKSHGYNTIVMGASFRSVGEIIELAGCDRLTISPSLLTELKEAKNVIERKLKPAETILPKLPLLSESEFRFGMNQNPMATEKLAEGIRNFIADQDKLEVLLKAI